MVNCLVVVRFSFRLILFLIRWIVVLLVFLWCCNKVLGRV